MSDNVGREVLCAAEMLRLNLGLAAARAVGIIVEVEAGHSFGGSEGDLK